MSSSSGSPGNQRQRFLSTGLPHTRLLAGEFFADIIHDRRTCPPLFLCVVQQYGSPEVLFLGQFHSETDAETAAMEWIADLRGGGRSGGWRRGRATTT